MTTFNDYLKRPLYFLFIAAMVSLPCLQPAHARDTDIYLNAPSTTTDGRPNFLIILDNSGSMGTIISNTQLPYDATVDYCTDDLDVVYAAMLPVGVSANASKPGSCASISDRIYWAFSSTTPPGMGSDQWFDSTKNNCLTSKDPTSYLAVTGKYSGDKVARWHGSGGNNNRNWKTLNNKTNSTITYVDCAADGNNNGQVTSDGTYPLDSTTTAYTSGGTAFSWSGFNSQSSPTLYTSNYMNYWHNSSLITNLSRMDVSKAAVNSIINTYTNVRFGLMAFNDNSGASTDGGRVLFRIDDMSSTRRANMVSVVNSLSPTTSTPLAETMWEAYRYFSGGSVTYGNPSTVQTPHQDSCAQNITNAACNNGGYYDAIGDGNSAYNTGTYISPFTYGCQKAFIIYVTDGDPTNDSSANSDIQTLTGNNCASGGCMDDLAEYMQNNDINGLPANQIVSTYTVALGTGISAAGRTYLSDTATKGGGSYETAIDGAGLQAALTKILDEALKSNTSFTAPSLSINAFNRLYNRDDVYFALFTPSSSQAWDGNLKKYQLCNTTQASSSLCTFGDIIDKNNVAAIDTSIDPVTLKPKNKIKDTAVSYWGTVADGPEVTVGGAGAKITQNSKVPRSLYTYRGSYASLSSSTPATPVAIVATGGNTVYDAAVADPTIIGLPAAATSTDVTNLINWMRGQDAFDDDADSNTTETREWNFADPLHSRPVSFTFGAVTSGGVPDPTQPISKMFMATNDGMVRMISDYSGEEEWAFIPSEMLDKQYSLYASATGDHVYGLDDSPSFYVIDQNGNGIIEPSDGDRVYMYIGMRRGGRNIYAFDVTPGATLTAQTDTITPKLMWVILGGTGNYAQLGQTWSRPKVTRIRGKCNPGSVCDDGDLTTDDSSSRVVLILGGGYDTNQDNKNPGIDSMGNAIYIVDPFNGSRIWWASSNAGASLVLPKMHFSIPSEIATVDTNGDKSVDRLYVGDMGGQIWRIDLGDQVGGAGSGNSAGYVFADAGCDSTAATQRVHDAAGACPVGTTDQGRRKFFYAPEIVAAKDAAYSTSENYDLVAIGSGDREDPLDFLTSTPSAAEPVHNRIYTFRDYNYAFGIPGTIPTTPISENVMYDATANNLGTLTGAARQLEIDTYVKGSKGWFIDLKLPSAVTLLNGVSSVYAGEKVLADVTVFNGVLYATTFLPANGTTVTSACKPNEGEAYYYALNYLTGEGVYDLNGDGTVDRSAYIGGGIPSEVVVVIRDGGVTALVGTSGGAAGVNINSSLPRYKTYWHDGDF